MQWADLDSSACSVARTLAVVGERWSLLIVRDVFNGIRRFDDLQGHLGIARNVLSMRLATLTDGGILTKVPYREGRQRQRHEYELTQAGRELVPIMLTLMSWGDRHRPGGDGPPAQATHDGCGKRVRMVPVCGAGHVLPSAEAIALEPGPGARTAEPPISGEPSVPAPTPDPDPYGVQASLV
ncbi:MAG: transcriptional regulator [Streptosporangiales bacterium]|nr:transcriptional regulator [Streptosporangiales bacterium]